MRPCIKHWARATTAKRWAISEAQLSKTLSRKMGSRQSPFSSRDTMLPKTFRVAALALTLSAASCSSENTLVTITGNVTLDGAPLSDGDILFTPADTQFGAEGAKIEN